MLAVLLCILQQIEKSAFSVVALEQLCLQLLGRNLVQLVVVVELVEVVDQLLVVLGGHVRLHLLHVVDLFLVAAHLLLHFLEDLVARRVSLLNVVVTAEELLGLVIHGGVKVLVIFEYRCLGCRGHFRERTGHGGHQVTVGLVFLADF